MPAKVFLDCGHYQGKALEYYAPLMDSSWKVYAFEPVFKEYTGSFPFDIELIEKAVWVKDGFVQLATNEREDASYVSELRNGPENDKVRSIDFSRFVGDLPDATIVCSMDIEGAEYPVLRKMIADRTIKRLSLLDIEFHERLMPKEDERTTQELRRQIEGLGVLVKLKI